MLGGTTEPVDDGDDDMTDGDIDGGSEKRDEIWV